MVEIEACSHWELLRDSAIATSRLEAYFIFYYF